MEFDLPDAKRVRREDLGDSPPLNSSSPSLDGIDTSLLQSQLATHFGDVHNPLPHEQSKTQSYGAATAVEEDEQPGELVEFRLFASGKPTKLTAKEDEDLENASRGLLAPRSSDWYLWGNARAEQVAREASNIAISGETINFLGKLKCKGLELSWRVITITLPGPREGRPKLNSGELVSDSKALPRQPRKPGKKRRIAIRKAAFESRAVSAKKEEKQTLSRQKKIRRNREKKVKKKAREKAKKAGAAKG
ncbi:MAG: hypothetical protein M1814_003543 [Vezdaea aestivalis]|nr:MAG: hypothetical protein M1814_003543 [Vezdaea aestivalis]